VQDLRYPTSKAGCRIAFGEVYARYVLRVRLVRPVGTAYLLDPVDEVSAVGVGERAGRLDDPVRPTRLVVEPDALLSPLREEGLELVISHFMKLLVAEHLYLRRRM
jgi:hypothetical protein